MTAQRLAATVVIFTVVFIGHAGATAVHSPHTPQLTPCQPVADALASSLATRQLILVVAPTPRSTDATVTTYQRRVGCFRVVSGPFGADVGRNGLSADRSEGDGTTPVGTFAIGGTFYGLLPNSGFAFAYHQLACGDWWDEQPGTPQYNQFVHVPCGTRPPFAGNSEALWRARPAYNYFAVIDFNTEPVVSGRGSGIFLHVSTGQPTDGCVALAQRQLLQVLRWLRPDLEPRIVITTKES